MIRQVAAGDVIFEEGDHGDVMYVVKSGAVEVSRIRSGQRAVLARLGEGGMFGEHGLLRGLPRSATVTAVADTALEELDRDALTERLGSDPLFALRLLHHLSDMTHRLADEYLSLASEHVPDPRDRLAEIEFEGRA